MSANPGRTQDPVLDATDACQDAHDETSQKLNEIQRMLLEMSHKLDAIMKHLGVPYEKKLRQFKLD